MTKNKKIKSTDKNKKRKKIFPVSITQLGNCFGKFNCKGAVHWATRLLVTFEALGCSLNSGPKLAAGQPSSS